MISRSRQCLRIALSCVWLASVSACTEHAAARDACAADAPRSSIRDSAGAAISLSLAAAALHTIANADELWRTGDAETDGVQHSRVSALLRTTGDSVLVYDDRTGKLTTPDAVNAKSTAR